MTQSTTTRTWFITGASTGFGRQLAEEVLASGGRVLATARKLDAIADLEIEYPGTAKTLALDVTDQAQVDSAVTYAFAHFGHIDVLVNNAGYGLAGAIEEATEAEFLPVFETNVFGLLRVTRAFLPYLRKQRSGHILNLSSIGGLIGTAGVGYYNASKFAVNGLSEALAAELAPLGIHVTVIEPGPFRTDFLGRSSIQADIVIPDYNETAGKTRAYFQTQDGKQKGDPRRAAHAMMAVVESPHPPKHLVLGAAAYNRMTARLDQWHMDLEAWKETSLGADFPEPAETLQDQAHTEAAPGKPESSRTDL